MSYESFGDIRHDRTCSTLNLSAEAGILLPSRILPNRLVDLASKLSGLFPAIEIFKVGNLHVLVCSVYSVCLVFLVGLACPVS